MSYTSATTDPESTQAAFDHTREAAKANLYLVLSRAFSSPLTMEPSDAARLRQVALELPDALQQAAGSMADAWERGLEHRQELSLAYARLFLGPFKIIASPYASFYLQPDQQLMGPVSQFVAAAYAEAGLEPGPGPREAPDHVALELEFMYFLSHQYLVSGDDQWSERRRAFASKHLALWLPSLVDAIKRSEEHEFYDRLAALLTDLIKGVCLTEPVGASASFYDTKVRNVPV